MLYGKPPGYELGAPGGPFRGGLAPFLPSLGEAAGGGCEAGCNMEAGGGPGIGCTAKKNNNRSTESKERTRKLYANGYVQYSILQ